MECYWHMTVLPGEKYVYYCIHSIVTYASQALVIILGPDIILTQSFWLKQVEICRSRAKTVLRFILFHFLPTNTSEGNKKIIFTIKNLVSSSSHFSLPQSFHPIIMINSISNIESRVVVIPTPFHFFSTFIIFSRFTSNLSLTTFFPFWFSLSFLSSSNFLSTLFSS